MLLNAKSLVNSYLCHHNLYSVFLWVEILTRTLSKTRTWLKSIQTEKNSKTSGNTLPSQVTVDHNPSHSQSKGIWELWQTYISLLISNPGLLTMTVLHIATKI